MAKITTYNPQVGQQTAPYDATKFNVQDGIEIKASVNAAYDEIAALPTVTGVNTGDETQSSILAKIGYTPYSAANPNGYITLAAVTKTQVGLGNADNTSDTNKPVSTAQATALALKEDKSNKNANNGYAGLDGSGRISANQLPSSIDQIVEYGNLAALPVTGAANIIYLTIDTNRQYRWSGSVYSPIIATPGTSDAVTEGSTNLYYLAARAALKADKTTTVNGHPLSANITVTATDVGLGNANDTSDANKPVSTAQATAIALKANLNSPAFTGAPTAPTAAAATNTTQIATTAFVEGELTANTISLNSNVFSGGTSGNPLNIIQIFNAQTASYTLVLSDAGIGVSINNASANNLTVPTNASVAFPVGTQILIASLGAGQTTIVAAGGVTINSAGGLLKLRLQYSSGSLIKTATNTWLLLGDLA